MYRINNLCMICRHFHVSERDESTEPALTRAVSCLAAFVQRVQAFYKEQHTKMTYDFVVRMEAKYLGLDHFKLGVWEALEYLDTFVDDSDPDTDLSQTQHALQTAEAIRAKYPNEEWFHLTGLIHDLGKILAIACKEPQWSTVGDSFPVGCAFDQENVFPQFFADNPDMKHQVYSTKQGIYQPNCGLDKVKMSWSV
jgi:inositol oxygenase